MSEREGAMRRFWDTRAREDAAHFVDDRLPYGEGDTKALFAAGEEVLAGFLDELGFGISPNDTVVEIGCGVGRVTRALAARAGSVIALDISAEMLERARELNRGVDNVEWLLGDGVSLKGVADSSADGCFSHVVFQHIPDPAITLAYIREIGRVLRAGGWAAFQISNDPDIHRRGRGRSLRERVRRIARRAPRGTSSPYWLGSAVELDELRRAAADGGLRIERVVREGTQFCLVYARRS